MFPQNDSPAWPILKLAVIGCLLAVLLHVGYQNGFDLKSDLPTIIAVLLGVGGWDFAAKKLGGKKDDER